MQKFRYLGNLRDIYGESNPIDVKNPLIQKALEVVAARIEVAHKRVSEAETKFAQICRWYYLKRPRTGLRSNI